MKTWRIPVERTLRGVIEIKAYRLSEALKEAAKIPGYKIMEDVKKPRYTELPDEPWKSSWDGTSYGELYIRQMYNEYHEDEIEELKSVVHARWIYFRNTNGIKQCKCSECLTSYGCVDTPYCPNCGAVMDLESEGKDE